ncbi:unnamed protein product [Citrullus colocynthis]|uniref:Uncharacterized protein n=1 Tax=Citrullus colocynthis TaxID=252529 RepID=A0ABP0Z4N0_9ROSI
MIDPETAILFTAAPLPGVEVGDGACAGGVEIEGVGPEVITGASEGAVGGAGGEVAGAKAGDEVPVEGEGAAPDGARDEDGVEAGGVATVGGGADFGEEDGGDLVGEEAGAAPGAWPRELAIKAKRTKKTKAEEEAMVVKNAKSRARKMEGKFELQRLKMREEEGRKTEGVPALVKVRLTVLRDVQGFQVPSSRGHKLFT